MEIKPLDPGLLGDLDRLFGSDKSAAGCWCMWFIIPVKEYHASGGAGNRENFRRLVAVSEHPLGLIAYRDQQPVGWCAVGPRSRYMRGIRTPTYAGRDPSEDDSVWLIPCVFVRDDARRSGITRRLVDSAASLAREHRAVAIEAFPLSGTRRYSRDTQVGFEGVFADCGFTVISRPSSGRALMRRDFLRVVPSG